MGRRTSRVGRTACGIAAVLLLVAASGGAAVPGDLDPGFGFASKVTTGISQYGDDAAEAVAVDPDGKIVAVGRSGANFAAVRYNADGTLDTSFGNDGVVTTSFGPGLEANANGVAVSSDSAVVVVGTARPPFNLGGQENGDFAVARYDENGNLDNTFGGDGRVTTEFGFNENGEDVAIQADGKIVAAGTGANGFALARYEADGDLDPTFSGDGMQTTDLGGAQGRSVAIQPLDGKIVVAGGGTDDFVLARYETDGDLDPTFDTDGKVTTDFNSGSQDEANDVAIQPGPGSEIVVAGHSNGDFALARYESDGDPNATFGGGDGLVTLDLGEQERANAVALTAGNTILAAGGKGSFEGEEVVGSEFALARFESDGDPDATFGGGDGVVSTNFGGTSNAANGVAVRSGGQIVVAGEASPPFASFEIEPGALQDFVLAQYESDGDLDPTFSGDGTVDTQIGDGFGDAADAVAVQADGKIVVAGRSIDESGPDDPDFAVARYAANGDPDTSFSGDGVLTDDLEDLNLFDSAHAVAVQGDGKIVVAGSSEMFGEGVLAVARYEADGDPDPTFSGDGKLTTDLGPGLDEGRDIAIQSNGMIVVSGGSDSGGLALARYEADGDPDTTFGGGDGKLTDSFFGAYATGFGVAIQPNGAIVVAGVDRAAPDLDGFGLARYEPDGDPDPTFSGDGKVTADFTPDNDFAIDVAVQTDGAIVAVGTAGHPDTPVADCGGQGSMDIALVRYEPDGDPDATFSGDGRLTTDFGGTDEDGNGLILQPDGAIAAAGRVTNDFALARYEPDGDLDPTFSGDGKVTTDFGAGSCDVARDVALSDGGILLAGFARDTENSRFALTRYLRTVPAAQPPAPPPPPPPPVGPAADTTPPETTIDSGPSGRTTDSTPTFSFSANEAGSTFQCRVDAAAFAPCTPPHTTSPLARAPHTFDVRAIDRAGNVDPTPASRAFTIAASFVRTTLAIASRSVTVTRGRFAPIRLRCGVRTPCRGTLTLSTSVDQRLLASPDQRIQLRLGSRAFSIPAGLARTVRVKLTLRGFRLLLRAKRLRAQARVRYRQVTGGTTTATRTITLRAPAARR